MIATALGLGPAFEQTTSAQEKTPCEDKVAKVIKIAKAFDPLVAQYQDGVKFNIRLEPEQPLSVYDTKCVLDGFNQQYTGHFMLVTSPDGKTLYLRNSR